MAKTTRKVIGSVCKGRENKPPYIKIRDGISLKKDQIVRLESKKVQLESLEGAVSAGKISPDLGEKIKERIENIPEFVLFELVLLEQQG